VSLTSSRPQELLIGQLLRNVRYCDASESKTRHLEKFKINISTRRTQNEILYTKALEYKEYFTHIAVRHITKSSRDIEDLVDMKFRILGQAVR
jgi:hypothetical protein